MTLSGVQKVFLLNIICYPVYSNTLRVKFPKEVKNILNEKKVSNKKIVEMQKFIEGSKEYKNLTKVGEEYQPYLRNINRESFDYQGINAVYSSLFSLVTKSGISISTLVPFFALMLSNLRKFVMFDIISNIC
jgi:hypothetical protein